MPRTELRETVERLHREIDAGTPLGDEQRQLLSEVLAEIEALLASDEADAPENPSIVAKLREAEGRFEQSHPNLTYAVGAVADALSKLGI